MPPFWRSLLGGSSSSSSSSSNSASQSSGSAPSASASTSTGSTSASSSRSSQLRKSSSSSLTSAPTPAGSSSSSLTAAPLKGGGGSSSTATSNGSGKHKSSSGSRSSQSSLAAGNAPHSAPIGIPNAGPAPGSSGQQQHQPPYQQPASLAGTCVTSGGLSSSVGGGELTDDPEANTDDGSIPETPFSTGHSPSHARHKFPQEEAGASATAAATSPSAHRSVNGAESDSSPPNAVASPSGGSLGLNSNSSQAPDIPTTHTILANPLPQPSSGLAAAISSVLPSSSSSNSAIGPSAVSPANGKASSSNADPAAPRTFDIDDMITRLLDVGYSAKITKSVCLKNSEITALCLAAREVFLSQPTLLELAAPVKVIGDIHGQYHDLIRLFEMSGYPPQANYLFLGDYVDRGKQSLETILLLLCYKVKYPENFFMLRGNHECANVTRVYGFYDECKRRCNIKVWKTFVDVFNCLPIASIVGGKIFCVHGGLSPSLSTMDDIRRISRPTDVPDYGLLNDLLWSDPSDTALDWEDNERGVSYCFGKAVINEFLRKYDFDLICRAHMVVEDGYEFWNERTLVTIFSAPNYCGEFDNYGAGLSCSSDLLCTFELLRPLEGPALRKELVKAQKNRSARGRG